MSDEQRSRSAAPAVAASGALIASVAVAAYLGLLGYAKLAERSDELAERALARQEQRDMAGERDAFIASEVRKLTDGLKDPPPELLKALEERLRIATAPVTVGRFQVITASIARLEYASSGKLGGQRDIENALFLIDTSTGDVWRYSPPVFDADKATVSSHARMSLVENPNIRPKEVRAVNLRQP